MIANIKVACGKTSIKPINANNTAKNTIALYMNSWVRILVPALMGVLITVFVLMFSGIATSTVLDSEGSHVTSTVVGLDVNVFAAVMLLPLCLSVFITACVTNRE